MNVHNHPVIQRVLLGLFVWALVLFSLNQALAQMPPAGYEGMQGPPAGIPTGPFPSDTQGPPAGIPQMPDLSQYQNMMPPGAGLNPGAGATDCLTTCSTNKAACFKDVIGENNPQAQACNATYQQCGQSCASSAGGIPGTPGVGAPSGMPDVGAMMQKGEEMRKKGEAEGLKRIKKGALGVQKSLKMLIKRIDDNKKKGAVVTERLSQAVTDSQTAYDALQAATDLDVAQGELEKLQAGMEIFAEEIPKLEMSAALPKILTQVEKQYTKLAKAVKSQRPKLSKIAAQVPDQIAELDSTVAGIRAAIDAASVKGLDPQEAMDKLQDEAFDKLEGAWQMYGSLEALRSMKAAIKTINAQIKANDKLIITIKKKGLEEATQLAEIQTNIKAKWAELQPVVTGTDAEAMMNGLQELGDLQQEFEDTLTISQDDGDATNDKLGTANNWGVPNFAPPSGMPGSLPTNEGSLKMMQQMAPYMPKSAGN
ncbi:MAG: hypothetical protein WCJ29_06115 [bacterium]